MLWVVFFWLMFNCYCCFVVGFWRFVFIGYWGSYRYSLGEWYWGRRGGGGGRYGVWLKLGEGGG